MKAQARLNIIKTTPQFFFWEREDVVANLTKEVEVPILHSDEEKIHIVLTRRDGSEFQTHLTINGMKKILDRVPILFLEYRVHELGLTIAALGRSDRDPDVVLRDIVDMFLNSGWTRVP